MSEKSSDPVLLWLDLEMTGLDPENDLILEVAVIATDFDFNELFSYQTKINQNQEMVLSRISKNPFFDDFKENKKIFSEVTENYPVLLEAENRILYLIENNTLEESAIYLAGNSIHMDRKFISKYMPKFDRRLHYRMLDVSSFKIVMNQKYNKQFIKTNQHRAMSDIEESINELKFYLKELGLKV